MRGSASLYEVSEGVYFLCSVLSVTNDLLASRAPPIVLPTCKAPVAGLFLELSRKRRELDAAVQSCLVSSAI